MNEIEYDNAQRELTNIWSRMDGIMKNATSQGRDLLASEQRAYDKAEQDLDRVLVEVKAANFIRAQRAGLGGSGGSAARGVLNREQRLTDHVRARGMIRDEDEGLSLQKWLRGTILGDWHGADDERAYNMAEGTGSAGGFMVPTPLSADIIDRARNQTRVMQAGALTVPMDSSTLKMARVAGDPTAAWHVESTLINPSDATLEQVTFTAHTLAGIVKLSLELVEDADNVDSMIKDIFAQVFALKLDQVALYGSGVAPEPQGVKGATGITTLSMGTNGLTPPSYDFLVDAVGTLADNNFTATGIIDAPRTERTLAKLKDTSNQPLRVPDYLAGVPRFSTNQVPVNLTQGTSADASDVFVADWSNLLIGLRHQFSVQVLSERYSDTGEIGLLCWFRGDVQLARPKAFVVTTGVRP